MKQLLLTLVAIAGLSTFSFSQTKTVQSVKIKTPQIVCEACKKRVEEYLKRYDGITQININYHKGEVALKFLSDRQNVENLKAAIANAGYDADEVPANPDAYKLLPKSCKKFEDGGGHPKPKAPVVATQ
jgi:periplasmic mercuric ion binding protein